MGKIPFQVHVPTWNLELGTWNFQDINETIVFDNSYTCDNCDQVFDNKTKLKKHIDNDQTYSLSCEKLYPTQESLEFHFDAVHIQGMAKHTLEREPLIKSI